MDDQFARLWNARRFLNAPVKTNSCPDSKILEIKTQLKNINIIPTPPRKSCMFCLPFQLAKYSAEVSRRKQCIQKVLQIEGRYFFNPPFLLFFVFRSPDKSLASLSAVVCALRFYAPFYFNKLSGARCVRLPSK